MTPIQILLLGVATMLFLGTTVAVWRRWLSRREGAVLAFLWVAGALAVIWPDLTTRFAQGLGIGRGSNLLIYLTCVVTTVGFVLTHVRFRRMERELTVLARHAALRDAASEDGPRE